MLQGNENRTKWAFRAHIELMFTKVTLLRSDLRKYFVRLTHINLHILMHILYFIQLQMMYYLQLIDTLNFTIFIGYDCEYLGRPIVCIILYRYFNV